jgi:hypothetical protein
VRLEPIILELEREHNDLLIIAHESVLRVLYGYLMACNATDIPFLSFPRNEIIEVRLLSLISSEPAHVRQGGLINIQIIPASYQNMAKRIWIPGLPEDLIPASPEGVQILVSPSGYMSPMLGGIVTPQEGIGTPRGGYRTPLEPERLSQQQVEDVV